jgi:hypothetical protein
MCLALRLGGRIDVDIDAFMLDDPVWSGVAEAGGRFARWRGARSTSYPAPLRV